MKRYVVPGWPRVLNGHSAVTPQLTRYAGSGSIAYKDGVEGQPGTLPIPVSPVVPSPDPGDIVMMGLSRSSDATNFIRPNLYYARPEASFWPGAGMPVSVNSDNLMPVPAADPRGIPARTAMPIVQRGTSQIRAVPALPAWAAW